MCVRSRMYLNLPTENMSRRNTLKHVFCKQRFKHTACYCGSNADSKVELWLLNMRFLSLSRLCSYISKDRVIYEEKARVMDPQTNTYRQREAQSKQTNAGRDRVNSERKRKWTDNKT